MRSSDAPKRQGRASVLGGPGRRFQDCSDFATQAEAQAFFLAAGVGGGPDKELHGLDVDRDRIACESLP